MKPIKFITTFSKSGYEVYGKTWLETFKQNVTDKSVSVDVYLDFDIPQQDRVRQIDFNENIPNHKTWMIQFDYAYKGGNNYNKKMAMRFSYKSFVMQHAIQNNPGYYVIWLDGDCIFKPNQDFSTFPQKLLNNKFIAVQREHNGGPDHCESGIVIFDPDHKDKDIFLSQFINNYQIENVIELNQPYDGFLIYKSLTNIDYVDLNDGYGRGGIQSDPNETFLHPEINKRFLHNIGITGKFKYDSFAEISKTDEYFRLIQGRNQKTPEEIASTRQNLIQLRNSRRNG